MNHNIIICVLFTRHKFSFVLVWTLAQCRLCERQLNFGNKIKNTTYGSLSVDLDWLIENVLSGCLLLCKKSPQTNDKATVFLRFSCVMCLGELLACFSVADSLSTPVCRKSTVFHWHTHLLLLWKVLFSCWVDICFTAMHTCRLMEWTIPNLDQLCL